MTEPVEVTDEEELVQAAVIVRRLEQAPLLLARYERLPAVPALGADVAGDDIATAWMTSSHLVNATLLMAADNMRETSSPDTSSVNEYPRTSGFTR